MSDAVETATQDVPRCEVCQKTFPKNCWAKRDYWTSESQPICTWCSERRRRGTDVSPRELEKTIEELRRLTPQQEAEFVREKRLRLLAALSHRKVDESTIKEITKGAMELFQIERLLQEKPTSIVDSGRREELMKLARELKEERARRAATIDVTPASSVI